MAYYGPAGRGWYYGSGGVYGGGGWSCVYGRGAGLLSAGWAQGRGVGEAAASMQGYHLGWDVSEHLRELGAKRAPPLAAAEAAADEVLLRFHPTEEEEKRRQEVINYAKQLIGTSFGCEVFAFGSVPLKTYLPDGDIDLTVLTNTLLDLTFIDDVRRLLKTEQQNTDSRFAVKKMQFINAEVKLIKCEIDNIIVDISFNQIGGVSTLCFLELVDSQVGKNHLFKRSIMLIKAWCYNECHILGAHHWLLSTYALEILVLHIFNVFHKSLHGPLEALYKFLEYYSKFDWDKYGLTLDGPIPLSSLRNFAVEPTATNDDLLLGKESLKGSFDRLLLLPRDSDRREAKFRLKHLNIVDPLKGSNNLGRSVNRVNFYHIRSAFSLGAQKLGQILLLASELIPDEIYSFFEETLKIYGGGERLDLGISGFLQSPETALREDVSSLEISYMSEDENRSPDNSLELTDKESKVKAKTHKTSGKYFPDDAKDRIWNKIWSRKSAADYYKMVSGASISAIPSYLINFTTHSFFYPENGNGSIKQFHNNCATGEDLSLSKLSMQKQHILTSSTRTNTLGVSSSCPDNKSNCTDAHQEKLFLPSFPPSNLLDLSGDLYLHLGCLRHVQYNLEAMFDEFHKTVQEASLAGLLNEDYFKIPVLKFLSHTNAAPPRLSLSSSTDTDRSNLSPVYCSHSTGDVPQQSRTEVHVDSANQQNESLSSGTQVPTNGWSSSPPSVADAKFCHVSWIYATEDIPEMHEVVTYMPDTIVPLSPGIEAVAVDWLDLAVSPSPTADSEDHHDSWVYMTGDIPKTRGTGTYIPQMNCGFYRDHMPRKYRQRQAERVHPSSQHTAGESARSQTPTKQNSSQQHVPKAAHPVPFKARAPTGCGTKHIPAGQTWKALNSQQQRAENGTPASQPPRLALPHHGGNAAQGNHLTVPTTTAGGQSSSPAAGAKDFKPLQEETLEFGTLGPFSPTLLTPKFIEDFPPLTASKRPTASTLKSSWPIESPASTVQSPKAQTRPLEALASSPRPGASAAQSRPEESYRLKDDADFPPLQAWTR